MNVLYGAKKLGKSRLKKLTLKERESVLNPTHGRSRAERILDESVGQTGKKISRVSGDAGRRISGDAGRRIKPRGQALQAIDTLALLIRRLALPGKLARNTELLVRFFNDVAGADILNTWREVISAGRDGSENDSSILKEAINKQCWMIYLVIWRLAITPSIASDGDARQNVILLFEQIFILSDENARVVCCCDQNGLGKWLDKDHTLSPDDLLIQGSAFQTDNIDISPLGQNTKEWYLLYNNLITVARLPALFHNFLFTDDSLIFNRSLQAIEKFFDSLPADLGSFREAHNLRPPLLSNPVDHLVLALPSPLKMTVLIHTWEFECFVTMADSFRLRPWVAGSVGDLFRKLFEHRVDRFNLLERQQIEDWQKILQQKKPSTSFNEIIMEPGQAIRPVADARETVIRTSAGADTWAGRQIT